MLQNRLCSAAALLVMVFLPSSVSASLIGGARARLRHLKRGCYRTLGASGSAVLRIGCVTASRTEG
jgi:hypothetical protein